MVVKRREIALSVTSTIAAAVVLACSVALVAQKKDDKKQTDAQKKEILDIVKIVDGGGPSATNDFGLAWAHEDYLKATANKEYIPFTVTFDASKVTSPNVALYWRVVAKDAAAPAATLNLPAKKDDKKDDKKAPAKYAYEDVNFVPVNTAQGANARLSRAFTVAAGTYDVYVVMKEPASSQKNAPAPKVSFIKQTVTVPDFWSQELTTSSVIIASRIEPLQAPLSPNEQIERPYALGMMEIVPTTDMKFSTKGELSVF
ncbi:MAG TPA: hypothetical protein VKB36_15585, partial [Vicinamibacterales bacterium]|nr:hypothetical protein [Vicinamibacterales bacterium]